MKRASEGETPVKKHYKSLKELTDLVNPIVVREGTYVTDENLIALVFDWLRGDSVPDFDLKDLALNFSDSLPSPLAILPGARWVRLVQYLLVLPVSKCVDEINPALQKLFHAAGAAAVPRRYSEMTVADVASLVFVHSTVPSIPQELLYDYNVLLNRRLGIEQLHGLPYDFSAGVMHDPALFILLPETNKWWLMTNYRYCGLDVEFVEEYKVILRCIEADRPMYSFDAMVGPGKILAGWKERGYGSEVELVHFLHDHPRHKHYTIALINYFM